MHRLHHSHWRPLLLCEPCTAAGSESGASGDQWFECVGRLRRAHAAAKVGRHTMQQLVPKSMYSPATPSPSMGSPTVASNNGFLEELLSCFADDMSGEGLARFAAPDAVATFIPAPTDDDGLPDAVHRIIVAAAAAKNNADREQASTGSAHSSAGRLACDCADCQAAELLDRQLLAAIEGAGTSDWEAVAQAAGSERTPDACRLWWSAVVAELKAEESAVGSYGALRVRDSALLLRLQNQHLRERVRAADARHSEAQAILHREDPTGALLPALRAKLAELRTARRVQEGKLEAELVRERTTLAATHSEQLQALRAYSARMAAAGPGAPGNPHSSPRERQLLGPESEMHDEVMAQLAEREQSMLSAHANEAARLAATHQDRRTEWLGVVDNETGKVVRSGPLGATDDAITQLTSDIERVRATATELEKRWLR
eukprot:SAG31_NODE_2055_length_6549_cov_100.814884_2_plen_431_part_00